mgnify:CR=1 FL=1
MEVDETIKQYLLEHGGNRWRGYGNDRIYFSGDIVKEAIYKEGFEIPIHIKSELRQDKIYYDLQNGKFYGLKETATAFRDFFKTMGITDDKNEDGILEEYLDD